MSQDKSAHFYESYSHDSISEVFFFPVFFHRRPRIGHRLIKVLRAGHYLGVLSCMLLHHHHQISISYLSIPATDWLRRLATYFMEEDHLDTNFLCN